MGHLHLDEILHWIYHICFKPHL